jgi:hypothetical protein
MTHNAARLALALYNSTQPEATSAQKAWGVYVHDRLAVLLYECDGSDGRPWDETRAAQLASDCLARLFSTIDFDNEQEQ